MGGRSRGLWEGREESHARHAPPHCAQSDVRVWHTKVALYLGIVLCVVHKRYHFNTEHEESGWGCSQACMHCLLFSLSRFSVWMNNHTGYFSEEGLLCGPHRQSLKFDGSAQGGRPSLWLPLFFGTASPETPSSSDVGKLQESNKGRAVSVGIYF